jgi:hypothetical protein
MGVGNWFKKKGTASIDFAKKNVNYQEIVETSSYIKKMASIALSPKEQLKNAKEETFQEAKARLGVSDIDLIQNYKNYAYICYVSLLSMVICFIGALYYLFITQNLLSALTMITIMCLSLVNAFKFSFRAFQIKHQKLCSINEWWDRANEWFPKI